MAAQAASLAQRAVVDALRREQGGLAVGALPQNVRDDLDVLSNAGVDAASLERANAGHVWSLRNVWSFVARKRAWTRADATAAAFLASDKRVVRQLRPADLRRAIPLAAAHGNLELVATLVAAVGLEGDAAGGEAALVASVAGGHVNVAAWLVRNNYADVAGRAVGFARTAARSGHADMLEWLWPLVTAQGGHDAAHALARELFAAAAAGGHVDVAAWLVERGWVDIRAVGEAALLASARGDHVDFVVWLVDEQGVDARPLRGRSNPAGVATWLQSRGRPPPKRRPPPVAAAAPQAAGRAHEFAIDILRLQAAGRELRRELTNAEKRDVAVLLGAGATKAALQRINDADLWTLANVFSHVADRVQRAGWTVRLRLAALLLLRDPAEVASFRPSDLATIIPFVASTEAPGDVAALYAAYLLLADPLPHSLRAVDEQALVEAARRGNLAVAAYLVDERAATVAGHDNEAMLAAAAEGRRDVVEWLQERGGDVHVALDRPLIRAAGGGHLPLARWLVDTEGADARTDGDAALMAAIDGRHHAVVEWLLAEHDADVFATTPFRPGGGGAYLRAARRGDVAMLRLLIGVGGADPNFNLGSSSTPLDLAAGHGGLAAVRYLVEDADATVTDDTMRRAAQGGDVVVLEWLVATGRGNAAAVRGLRDLDPDVRAWLKDRSKAALAALAANRAQRDIMKEALREGNLVRIRMVWGNLGNVDRALTAKWVAKEAQTLPPHVVAWISDQSGKLVPAFAAHNVLHDVMLQAVRDDDLEAVKRLYDDTAMTGAIHDAALREAEAPGRERDDIAAWLRAQPRLRHGDRMRSRRMHHIPPAPPEDSNGSSNGHQCRRCRGYIVVVRDGSELEY